MCVRGLHNRHKEKKGRKVYLSYGIKHAYLSCQGIWVLKVYDNANKQHRVRLIESRLTALGVVVEKVEELS